MKKKTRQKLLKLMWEARDESMENAENYLMGKEQSNTAYLRLVNYTNKKIKEGKK